MFWRRRCSARVAVPFRPPPALAVDGESARVVVVVAVVLAVLPVGQAQNPRSVGTVGRGCGGEPWYSCPAPSPSLYGAGDWGPPVTNGLGTPIRHGQGVRLCLCCTIWRVVHVATGLIPPKSIAHILSSWLTGISKKERSLIFVRAATLMWVIWCTRNDLIFEKKNIYLIYACYFEGSVLAVILVLATA